MNNSLFSSSTIPALEQVVAFTQKRHGVLASNIANMSTPGYRTRDLSQQQFETRLKEALDGQREARQLRREAARQIPSAQQVQSRHPVHQSLNPIVDGPEQSNQPLEKQQLHPEVDLAQVREATESILYHDDSNVSIEQQVAEIGKNKTKHNAALTIMVSQFKLLQAAISERP